MKKMKEMKEGDRVAIYGYGLVLEASTDHWPEGSFPYFNGHVGTVDSPSCDGFTVRLDSKDLRPKSEFEACASHMAGSLVALHRNQARRLRKKCSQQ